MKKKLTTILAMCLCAIMMVTAINPSTAYAAEKTPVKVTKEKDRHTGKGHQHKAGAAEGQDLNEKVGQAEERNR